MHVNDLPDDCIRFVFDQFSLQHLIQLRQVCLRWRSLVEQICAHKSSLKLFESLNVVFNYCNCLVQYSLQNDEDFTLKAIGHGDDDLLVRGIHPSENDNTPNVGHLLVELFPSLSRLVFYYYNWPTQMELPFFLNKWTSLTSLALFGMPHLASLQLNIWTSIGSLQSLTRLHLFEVSSLPDEMPVLAQLEHFTLVNYDGDIALVLRQLGPAIRHLVLDGITCNYEQFEHLLENNQHLALNVTHLTIGHLFTTSESNYKSRVILKKILHLICTKFCSLHSFLPKFVYELPLGDQITELVNLKDLSELGLRIYSFQMRLNSDPAALLSQLRSVRVLSLDYILMDHDIPLANLVPLKFYNVHTLNVTIECDDADFGKRVEQFFTKLRAAQQKYQVNISDNHVSKFIGRHKRRYFQVYESDD